MMRLADIVTQYAPALLEQHCHELLPSQRKALSAIQQCRSATAPKMQLTCDNCDESSWLPHSCGNRHCPHCQAHESQRWIDKQLQRLVPGEYFMVTFTLPAQFRQLAWRHQRELYELIIRNAWATANTFSQNDKKLRGTAGAVTVFLRKILLHILPKGFRRARNFGFLHPNSKLVKLVQLIKQVVVPPRPRPVVSCTCCGRPMRIVRTRVRCERDALRSLAPIRETAM